MEYLPENFTLTDASLDGDPYLELDFGSEYLVSAVEVINRWSADAALLHRSRWLEGAFVTVHNGTGNVSCGDAIEVADALSREGQTYFINCGASHGHMP